MVLCNELYALEQSHITIYDTYNLQLITMVGQDELCKKFLWHLSFRGHTLTHIVTSVFLY